MSKTDEIMAAEGWLRIDKAAELVGVHASTITRLICAEAGQDGLEDRRVGRRRYVSARSLLRHYQDVEPIAKRIREHISAAS